MPSPFNPGILLWSTNGQGRYNMAGYLAEAVPTPAQFAAASGQIGPFDVSTYREIFLEVLLASFTGGTSPTFQPEWDALDDDVGQGGVLATGGTGGGNVIPLWKPSAASAATNWLALLGAGQGAAPTIPLWVVATVPIGFGPFGQLKWTTAGAPTAVAVKAFVYAK